MEQGFSKGSPEASVTALSAIRGAIQAEADTPEAIEAATLELLKTIVERNGLEAMSIAAAWFTQTRDLTTAYPAETARRLGWDTVPMMCAQEAEVEGSMPRTIRTMVFVVGDGTRTAFPVYLGAAQALRPDLCNERGGRPG